ncbi:MAG: hypothetical protein AABZ49_04310, partial [Thermoproteota archaeon]
KEEIEKIKSDPTKDDAVQKAKIEKLEREINRKQRPIKVKEDLERKIEELETKAEERAKDGTLWPPFSKSAKVSVEQESLTTQPQENET